MTLLPKKGAGLHGVPDRRTGCGVREELAPEYLVTEHTSRFSSGMWRAMRVETGFPLPDCLGVGVGRLNRKHTGDLQL